MHHQPYPSGDPKFTMESPDTKIQQHREIMAVETLLPQLRIAPERGCFDTTNLNTQFPQASINSHDGNRALTTVSPGATIPKTHDSTRLTALASSLPKLSIPLPLNPLETFPLFPKLPIDIRVKIWKLIALKPRQVKLFLLSPTETRHKSRLIEGQRKIPEIMHVNRESRAEGLRYYTLCKENVWPSDPFKAYRGPNHLYINFDIDHFAHDVSDLKFVNNISLESYAFGPEVLKRIKFVDVLMPRPGGPPPFMTLRYILRESEDLVEFRVIMSNSALRSTRFYDKHEVGIEDFQLKDGAIMTLLTFLILMRTSFAKKSIGKGNAFGHRGLLSAVFMESYPPAVKAAWDFSLEFLELQPRAEMPIIL
ncbi:hypothetical protein N431DRAFT_447172 [Stipitochalara longipes BDJ]|nr:hypothetical protein N431DRAFT_447172 [Stipitochalara longipes BDJ]